MNLSTFNDLKNECISQNKTIWEKNYKFPGGSAGSGSGVVTAVVWA